MQAVNRKSSRSVMPERKSLPTHCTACGGELQWKPSSMNPPRVQAFCKCHPLGAVMECDAPIQPVEETPALEEE